MFRRLGALPNGFSLEQARVLAAGPDTDEFALLDAMAVLIERSLLLAETSWPTVYRMPESVRAYALLQLQAAAEHEVIARAAQISEAAADEAMASGRAVESLARLGVALELCALLPEGEARDERELAIDLRMGPAIQSVLGPAHPRCEAVYRRARDLARRAGPVPAEYPDYDSLEGQLMEVQGCYEDGWNDRGTPATFSFPDNVSLVYDDTTFDDDAREFVDSMNACGTWMDPVFRDAVAKSKVVYNPYGFKYLLDFSEHEDFHGRDGDNTVEIFLMQGSMTEEEGPIEVAANIAIGSGIDRDWLLRWIENVISNSVNVERA